MRARVSLSLRVLSQTNGHSVLMWDAPITMLKRNKYVGILSIAVMTLQYITISMITIFSMYIAHVCSGSGRNSYQGHMNDSGEFC